MNWQSLIITCDNLRKVVAHRENSTIRDLKRLIQHLTQSIDPTITMKMENGKIEVVGFGLAMVRLHVTIEEMGVEIDRRSRQKAKDLVTYWNTLEGEELDKAVKIVEERFIEIGYSNKYLKSVTRWYRRKIDRLT